MEDELKLGSGQDVHMFAVLPFLTAQLAGFATSTYRSKRQLYCRDLHEARKIQGTQI